MEMISVESSNVAAIGYDPDIQVLAIRYRDDSLYIHVGVRPQQFYALCGAPSKGKWLHENTRGGIKISKGGANIAQEQSGQSSGPVNTSGEATGPLDVLDENAGICCRRYLHNLKGDRDPARLICPECGLEYRAAMEGPVRYWRIHEHFAVHRR